MTVSSEAPRHWGAPRASPQCRGQGERRPCRASALRSLAATPPSHDPLQPHGPCCPAREGQMNPALTPPRPGVSPGHPNHGPLHPCRPCCLCHVATTATATGARAHRKAYGRAASGYARGGGEPRGRTRERAQRANPGQSPRLARWEALDERSEVLCRPSGRTLPLHPGLAPTTSGARLHTRRPLAPVLPHPPASPRGRPAIHPAFHAASTAQPSAAVFTAAHVPAPSSKATCLPASRRRDQTSACTPTILATSTASGRPPETPLQPIAGTPAQSLHQKTSAQPRRPIPPVKFTAKQQGGIGLGRGGYPQRTAQENSPSPVLVATSVANVVARVAFNL